MENYPNPKEYDTHNTIKDFGYIGETGEMGTNENVIHISGPISIEETNQNLSDDNTCNYVVEQK